MEYDICMWNRDIMYGNKSGTIQSGCFHSCGLKDAKYLLDKMLKDVLLRFKKMYLSGNYEKHKDNNSTIELKPLLTESESNYIKEQRHLEIINEKLKRLKQAKKVIQINPNDEEWISLLGSHYGTNQVQELYDGNTIDFSNEFAKGIVGGENLTYDECLDLQWKSKNIIKHTGFQTLYYNITLGFKGQIERKTKKYICFKRIYIDGMYQDGICFTITEDHVSMSKNGFEKYNVGDSVKFFAEVYKYIKKSNGKSIDFGLRNPEKITKIDNYKLPSKEEIVSQYIDNIICESCFLYEQCNGLYCIKNNNKQEL